MNELRRIPFLIAVVFIALVVFVETGAHLALDSEKANIQTSTNLDEEEPDEEEKLLSDLLEEHGKNKNRGIGIPYLALIDGLVLFTVLLMGVSLLIPERVHGRVQGGTTFIISLLLLIGGIVLITVALLKLALMLLLLVSPPFGTITYLAVYGRFPTGDARIALSLILFLKLVFAFFLVIAQQRFLQNKGLVLVVLTSLLATILVSFLHGMVPGLLVSITDAIAAIIVAVLSMIWAVVFLVGSVISIAKAVH